MTLVSPSGSSFARMDRTRHLRSNDGILQLGRLDGRLHNSACADIFIARSRLEGAVALSALAGVPISIADLHHWIAGRTPPPRASEGLNDPISVAAIFHVALTRDDDAKDPLSRSTLNTLRTILDDRDEARTYGSNDLVHFGPLWRRVREIALAPFAERDLLAVAERVFELAEMTEQGPSAASEVATIDGRTWQLSAPSRDRNWLFATAMPLMLHRAGFTGRVIPSLTLLEKFLPASPGALSEQLADKLGQVASAGLRDLTAIERSMDRAAVHRQFTKRSKAPLLARLLIAYPGLQAGAVATLLGVTPQGARKLLAATTRPSDPMLV